LTLHGDGYPQARRKIEKSSANFDKRRRNSPGISFAYSFFKKNKGAGRKHPASPGRLAFTPGRELNESGKKAFQERGPEFWRAFMLLGFMADVYLKKSRTGIRRRSSLWDFRRHFS
jgi:hypothetical protein